VRSPFPHARIVSIDTSRAKLVPGVRAIITAADIPDLLTGHQGQIDGSVIQGVGYALMEELILDDGRITTTNFNDYKMPTILDVPELITVNVPDPGTGPFGAKSIGEIPHIPTAGAITNAVADAIGAPMFELPVTAERVLAAIRSRG
jgi:CO/xanthine dehydrogenase Mo-binding subunit